MLDPQNSQDSAVTKIRPYAVTCGGAILLIYMLVMAYSYGFVGQPTSSIEHTIIAGDEISQSCASLGVAKTFSVGEKHRKIGNIHKHTFKFPSPMDHHHICVPAKSGNKNWGALMYKLWFGKVPLDEKVVDGSKHNFQRSHFDESRDRVWLLHRDPYVRFLSTFIGKVYCVKDCISEHHYYHYYHRFQDRGNITFEAFVDTIYNDVVGTDPSTHLSPLQRGEALCYLDKHLCIQAAGLFKLRDNSVRALKLEDQGSWYRQFLSCMNIDPDLVVGDEWTSLNGMPCFYTPTGNCDDALKAVDNAGLYTDHLHGKGSVDRMADFYTAKIAQKVTYLYEYDLKMLDYPVWDGVKPYSA